MGATVTTQEAVATRLTRPKSPARMTRRAKAWAKLLARVGEEFPLACPTCGGDIRLIAFITEPGPIRKILTHLGEPLEPSPVSPGRRTADLLLVEKPRHLDRAFSLAGNHLGSPHDPCRSFGIDLGTFLDRFFGRSRGRRWHPSRRQAGSRRRAARRRHRDGRPTTRCVRAARWVPTPGSGVAPPLAAK